MPNNDCELNKFPKWTWPFILLLAFPVGIAFGLLYAIWGFFYGMPLLAYHDIVDYYRERRK